ncbi:hypothetical protein OO010_12570 [Flavobacteriaceae bacterium KMM 6898]|nr:hypothetical protein [Flavobacteriaceae bacterium KMM 6898]
MEKSKNPITIISENRDRTTDETIKWLIKDGIPFNRHNYEETSGFSICFDNSNYISTINKEIPKNKVIWFRRGRFQFLTKNCLISNFNINLRNEELPIVLHFEKYFNDHNHMIGSYKEERFNNKIENLLIAKKNGLNIPKTLVTNKKTELELFFKNNIKIMSKNIYSMPNIRDPDWNYKIGTNQLVTNNQINRLSSIFAPSIIQEYIEKSFEVRIFVFEDQFYAMAIFSQKDDKTKFDFRNYNEANPNRNVPFELPSIIKRNLTSFLKEKKMNTGSIDLIVTPNNEFYFLEINPQGQLDWLSKNCNYYVEKEIANILKLRNEKIAI